MTPTKTISRRDATQALGAAALGAPALMRQRYALFAQSVEHVAIGSDLDVVGNPNPVNGGGFDPKTQPNFSRYQYHEGPGGAITIAGLDHPKRVFDLTEGLIRRGYGDADIARILGGNAMRALGAIWPAQDGAQWRSALRRALARRREVVGERLRHARLEDAVDAVFDHDSPRLVAEFLL